MLYIYTVNMYVSILSCEKIMTYSVSLQDFPDIPDNLKKEAERRFMRTLERAIGSEETLLSAYTAWCNVQDSGGSEGVAHDEIVLARQWLQAASRAQQDGFSGLGDAQEAYFDFRVGR